MADEFYIPAFSLEMHVLLPLFHAVFKTFAAAQEFDVIFPGDSIYEENICIKIPGNQQWKLVNSPFSTL